MKQNDTLRNHIVHIVSKIYIFCNILEMKLTLHCCMDYTTMILLARAVTLRNQSHYSGTSENGLPLLRKLPQCGQESAVPNCIALYYSCYKETSILRTLLQGPAVSLFQRFHCNCSSVERSGVLNINISCQHGCAHSKKNVRIVFKS